MVYTDKKYEDEKKNVFYDHFIHTTIIIVLYATNLLFRVHLFGLCKIYAFSVYFFRILNLKSFKELQLIVFKCMLHTSYNDWWFFLDNAATTYLSKEITICINVLLMSVFSTEINSPYIQVSIRGFYQLNQALKIKYILPGQWGT